MIAYSVTISKYDPAVRAHRECNIWIHRARQLTETGIQRIVDKMRPGSAVIRVERFAVQNDRWVPQP